MFSVNKNEIKKHPLKTYKMLYDKLISCSRSQTELINYSIFMNSFIKVLFTINTK